MSAQETSTAPIDGEPQASLIGILERYRLGSWTMYPKGVKLEKLDLQRTVDENHVHNLCNSYINDGVFHRNHKYLHAVALDESGLHEDKAEVYEGTFGFLIGQHRMRALKAAVLQKGGISEAEAWWSVVVYKKGI